MGRHYLSQTKEYRIWMNMRVNNNEIDETWKSSPTDFIGYIRRLQYCGATGYTLARIDTSMPFQPGNVKFIKRAARNAKRHFKGYVGIRKRGKAYTARIIVNKTEITIGTAPTIEKAVALRNDYILKNGLPHKIQKL